VARLVSVEHDSIWGERVRQRLQEEGFLERVDYRLQQDGKSGSADSAYVHVANDIPQQDLDFCLVDGVARDHCVLACLDLLRLGGIMIADNINWYVPSANPRDLL
jgi:predicted O-methyltransferase YrrM